MCDGVLVGVVVSVCGFGWCLWMVSVGVGWVCGLLYGFVCGFFSGCLVCEWVCEWYYWSVSGCVSCAMGL